MITQELLSLVEATPRVTLYPELIKLTGSATAGMLLSQLVYWFQRGKNGQVRATITRAGRRWTAVSSSYAERFYGLSRQEFRTALDKLESLGVVVKSVWRYGGTPTTHLSLDCNQLQSLLVGDNQSTGCQQPNTICTSTSTSTCSATGVATPSGENGESIEEKEKEGKKGKNWNQKKEKLSMATIKEALEKIKNKKEKLPDKVTAASLALLWKKRKSMDGSWVKDLTQKEVGQLKHFLKAVGDQEALQVMDFSLSEWGSFAWAVKADKGQVVAPDKPVIGFLLAHVDVLMNLYKKHKGGGTKSHLDKTGSVGYFPSKLTPGYGLPKVAVKPEEKYVATEEEIAAQLAELDKLTGQ